jgi:hypothetical protein
MGVMKRKLRAQKQTPFAKLNNDVLLLIFEQIYLADLADLLQVCLVSRDFYLRSTHWIYRRIEFDFSQDSHLHLLQRLARGDTKLPSRIRELEFMNTDVAPLFPLYLFLSRLTNITSLIWNGSLHIPIFVLDKIKTAFPGARITINAAQANNFGHEVFSGSEPLVPVCIFKHAASKHLSSFILHPAAKEVFYGDFKFDLVRMLLSNPRLKILDIWDSFNTAATRTFPSMISRMRGARLPQLEKLRLMTSVEIFTIPELASWGRQGGWAKLEELQLHDPDCLLSFIGQIPNLETLRIRTGSSWDSDEVNTFLEEHSFEKSPLGRIRQLKYKVALTDSESFIPWTILKRIPGTITHLDIARYTYSEGDSAVATPNVESIRALRDLCPGLCKLSLDVTIVEKAWPYPLLFELALFKKPVTLVLYLHQPHQKNLWKIVSFSNVHKTFDRMVEIRKLSGLPIASFRVEFKIVRPWDEMRFSFNSAERSWWINAKGDPETRVLLTLRPIKSLNTQELQSLPTAVLEKRRNKLGLKKLARGFQYNTCLFSSKAYQERGIALWEATAEKTAIEKEIRRRENRARMRGLDCDESLYDRYVDLE